LSVETEVQGLNQETSLTVKQVSLLM